VPLLSAYEETLSKPSGKLLNRARERRKMQILGKL